MQSEATLILHAIAMVSVSMSSLEFILQAQASSSTDKLDEHLEVLKRDSTARPTAIELLESMAELAQGTQAVRAALMLSLAARVVVKSNLTLEDVETRIPQSLQLSLLLHVRKLVCTLDAANRAEWECHVYRWVLRSVVRGEDPFQGGRQLPGGPADEGETESLRDPATAATELAALVSTHSGLASAPAVGSVAAGVDLCLLCVTSHDLAEWHLHHGELKRAEELFRMALAITHRLATTDAAAGQVNRRCAVRPERLSALALALRMLRLSQPSAPPTPLVKTRIGNDAASAADSEIPISPAAVMVLTAELLQIAGQKKQLIKLLHFDNVLRLTRWLADGHTSASSNGGANGTADVARAIVPLPWAYREHLCTWMLEAQGAAGADPSPAGHLAQQAAAANCVVTLASAPDVSALVSLKMLQGAGLDSFVPAHCKAPQPEGSKTTKLGSKHQRLTSQRLECSTLVIGAVRETIKMLKCAKDAATRTTAVQEVFAQQMAQADALTPMLLDALAAAADTGLLSVAQTEMGKTLEALESASRAPEPGGGGARQRGAPPLHLTAQKKRRLCGPSDLAAFLRSAGKWQGGGREADTGWMEELKKEACVSDQTLLSWFPAARDTDMHADAQNTGMQVELAPVHSVASAQSLAPRMSGHEAAHAPCQQVRECCKSVALTALAWAAVLQVNDMGSGGGDAEDEEAEAFGKVQADIRALVSAATAAGGREMFDLTFPQRWWFAALSDLSQKELEAIASLQRAYNCRSNLGRSHSHADAHAQDGQSPQASNGYTAPSNRSRHMSEGLIVFLRAVLALLQVSTGIGCLA